MNYKTMKQKGFTLVEVGIVVILLTLITAAKLREEARDLRISIAQAQGQQLKTLNAGLYTYGLRHFNEIVANSAVAGVAVTRAPTVTELVAIGDLTSGFSPNGYYGATYITSIVPAPAACVAPNCNIAGLVYLNQPINDPFTGTVDGPSIGEAVMAIGADGGSSLRVPGTIQGANGGWAVPNPLGGVRGILAARSGLGSELDLTGYLKRDGTLPMTGNLSLGANSITNLATVVENSACASTGMLSTDASGAVLTCQAGLYKRQGSNFWQDPVATVAALPACNATISGQTRVVRTPTVGTGPRAYSCTGVAWLPLAVDDSGNLTVAGKVSAATLQLNTVSVANTACAPNGLLSRNATGGSLTCDSGFWSKPTSQAPITGATASMVLPGGGTYTIQVVASYFTCVDTATGLNLDGVRLYTYGAAGGDTEGCDQNTLTATQTGVAAGGHNFSLTQGGYQTFNWTAYKE